MLELVDKSLSYIHALDKNFQVVAADFHCKEL